MRTYKMQESINLILDSNIIEKFCKSYNNKLSQYRLSYYIRSNIDNGSKENAIHSSIIWTRQTVYQINNSKTIDGSNKIEDLMILIANIDILLEATEQVYRVLYDSDKVSKFSDEQFYFKDAPNEYNNLSNRDYFKEIRSLFGAHPVNLKSPNNIRRFADIPMHRNDSFKLVNLKGDFNIRLWTATKNDENTIHFPLYIKDLVKYSQIIYKRYEMYNKRLIDISKKNI